MQYVETGLGRVAYELNGEGPPVVLLHATLHDRHDFDDVTDSFKERYRVLVIDWPGHGDSDPRRDVTADDLAVNLAEILTALDIGPAVLIGNSVGGFAAARLAIDHPGAVRGLVLVNTGGFSPQNSQAKLVCRTLGSPRIARRVAPLLVSAYLRPLNESDRTLGTRVVDRIRSEEGSSTFSSLWRSFAHPGHDLRAEASRISAPTLIVWGTRDRIADARWGRTAHRLIPGSRYAELDTGHIAFASDPAAFLQIVDPFVESAFSAGPQT